MDYIKKYLWNNTDQCWELKKIVECVLSNMVMLILSIKQSERNFAYFNISGYVSVYYMTSESIKLKLNSLFCNTHEHADKLLFVIEYLLYIYLYITLFFIRWDISVTWKPLYFDDERSVYRITRVVYTTIVASGFVCVAALLSIRHRNNNENNKRVPRKRRNAPR